MTKRQESGKKLGRGWKEEGHAQEFLFNAKFFKRSKINFAGSSADCVVNDDTALKLVGLGVKGRTVSLKSGSTAQFHLGDIPELSDKPSYERSLTDRMVRGRLATCGTHSVPWAKQQNVLGDERFWKRIVGKGDYYVQLMPDKRSYVFFSMDDVIAYIVNNTSWRLLETGRIKGDLPMKGSKRLRAVLTFEFRPSHSSFVLGAHGGASGHLFAKILMENIPYKMLR